MILRAQPCSFPSFGLSPTNPSSLRRWVVRQCGSFKNLSLQCRKQRYESWMIDLTATRVVNNRVDRHVLSEARHRSPSFLPSWFLHPAHSWPKKTRWTSLPLVIVQTRKLRAQGSFECRWWESIHGTSYLFRRPIKDGRSGLTGQDLKGPERERERERCFSGIWNKEFGRRHCCWSSRVLKWSS